MKLPEIHVEASAYLFAACCILILPPNWLIGWLTAVTFHESGHLIAIRLNHIPVSGIRISIFGAEISTGSMTAMQELLAAGAGPICSLLLLAFVPIFPVAALIGLVQGAFNLLPVYPLDGGRMLRSLIILIR